MASVWSARDEVTGGRVALKRLSKSADAAHVALFEREYHTLASLRHPSIVEAYDYGSDATGPFYTMELLDGCDVSELAPIAWPEVCRTLRDVASALALLHARRLVHRDVTARNVWLKPDRRIKLIDFGAMAAFGKPRDIAGTPPFVAPESLHGLDVDQRTDLYALGALGYLLLSGRHAYPAHSLVALEAMWRERPRPVGQRVKELERSDLPEVPAALEALLESLLSLERLGRPTTAADVIDRLNVIAALEPDKQVRALDSYLSSPGFVGRAAERAVLRDALAKVVSGSTASVVVESSPGLGRSRLLDEIALEARLAGAVVLQCDARLDRETHGVAVECAMLLLAAHPAAAEVAKPYAPTLGHLSPQLRDRLGLRREDLAVMPQAFGETRQRVQSALRDWFLDLARERTTVLVADNVDAYDEGSAAWLASLAREGRGHKLGVFASVRSDRAPSGLAVQALCHGSTRVVLPPMSHDETAALFRSVFGDVPHLARLVDRMHQRSEGNPALAIELTEHLGRTGVIAYADGAWVLPQEVTDEMLPVSRSEADVARLDRLPGAARRLGQVLAVADGQLGLELCGALADVAGPALFEGLDALVRNGVLAGSTSGYRFTRDSLRSGLQGELDETRRGEAHRRLGRFLLASENLSPLERLKAGVHLLEGGDDDGGSLAVAEAGKHYGLVDLADLGPAWPSLEVALARFRATRRSPYEIASVLAPLALAGYYAERRMADRHGNEAVDLLQTLVGLKLARRLRGILGRRLGLFVALAVAAVAFALRRRNPRVPTFREAMMMLFYCVAALSGVSTICVDPAGGARFASVIEPLTALGPEHVASFMHQFCLNLAGTIRDRITEARANWMRMLERLDRPETLRELPPNVHVLYLAGALYALGVIESWREDGRELALADRLDAFKLKLYELSADQLRMMHYGNRGQLELFERYRERVEMHAIQRGTAWQVETWTFSQLTNIYVRWGHVAGIKECAEQLKRLSEEIPTLQAYHARSMGAYLLLRGSPKEALEWLGRHERPLERVGWARGQGLRARAYNDLGDHAAAREVCTHTLELLDPADLEYCVMNLGVAIELARAEAGLGRQAEAAERLRGLLSKHEGSAVPLTLGSIHEAMAELAAVRGDGPAFEASLREVEKAFRHSGNPALVVRYERLARRSAESGPLPIEHAGEGAPRMLTLVHKLKHGGDHSVEGSARWALSQLSRYAGMDEALLFAWDGGQVRFLAQIGDGPADLPALITWVNEQLRSLRESDAMATATAAAEGSGSRLEMGGVLLQLTPLLLLGKAGGEDEPVQEVVGAIVTPGGTAVPFPILQSIAERISSTARSSLSAKWGERL